MIELAKRYAAPVPRYTSYPTALHFNDRVGPPQARHWLSVLPASSDLSLYFHFPFCRELCWYCACTTSVANDYARVERYVDAIGREIEAVASLVPRSHRVGHIHWGGGSPNILAPREIGRLAELTRSHFHVGAGAEFAVEIDPRDLSRAQVEAFRVAGVNRASIGVQDFDETVQAAINRRQSYETTRVAVSMLRDAGIGSLNIDLVYGLPHQTRASVARTLDQVLTLEPDRIAIFGYAHLPSKIRRQRLIEDSALAGPVDRLGQANRLARALLAAGYVRIGLDHFAKPGDSLAQGGVNRNFQGYTTDACAALIGFGASAISRFAEGYAQNAADIAAYERLVADGGLATARGTALSGDDRVRGYVIERLMCDLAFSAQDVAERFPSIAAPLIAEAEALLAEDRDGLIEATADGFRVTERGRPFVRSIAACFDAYLGGGTDSHSAGV
jgi:oxygen-independent coproporphyrinogen-3 oxidase